jgi:hypothetical protein
MNVTLLCLTAASWILLLVLAVERRRMLIRLAKASAVRSREHARLLEAEHVHADDRSIISGMRVSMLGNHCHVDAWVRGGHAGTLVVGPEDCAAVVRLLGGPGRLTPQ